MRSNTIIFLLVLSCVCLSLAQTTFEDCCYSYVKKSRRILKLATNYRHQVVDGGCNIPATIFTLKSQRLVCVDPHDAWVIHLIKRIDRRRGRHDHNKPKTLYRS